MRSQYYRKKGKALSSWVWNPEPLSLISNHNILPSWLTETCKRKEGEEENIIGIGRKTKGITEFRKVLFLLQRMVFEKEGWCVSYLLLQWGGAFICLQVVIYKKETMKRDCVYVSRTDNGICWRKIKRDLNDKGDILYKS